MVSLQNSAGAGKAAKFVDANPLAPMADPFEGLVRFISIVTASGSFLVSNDFHFPSFF
jgi:hypothetical protein